jgi:GT2 family glycosyltransferase
VTVGAVVLNWKQAALTIEAVESVRAQVDHVYVVDNASGAGDVAMLRRVADGNEITLIENRLNLGYAGGNNVGIGRALQEGWDAVLVMNSDTVAEPGAVAALTGRLQVASAVAAVAPMQISYDTGAVLHTACSVDLRSGRTHWHDAGADPATVGTSPIDTGYISGAAFLARRRVLEACGTFDERFFCYWEDTEWSVRVRRGGWSLEVVPGARFRHHRGASTPSDVSAYYMTRNRVLFLRRAAGRSRAAAFRATVAPTLVMFVSLARRGRIAAAFRCALGGWVAGLASRA